MATARQIGSGYRERTLRFWWREALVVLAIIAFGFFALGASAQMAPREPLLLELVDQ